MEYKRAVNYLQESSRFRINPSLKNISRFLEQSNLLLPRYRSIQVLGTNGKTSTALMIGRLLSEKGKTGVYISPHVNHYGERFSVNGKSLSSQEFGQYFGEFLKKYRELINKSNLTEFEILTSFAVWLFDKESVDYAVFEAGLGGRFDATSTVEHALGVLTSVSLEHEKYLGRTISRVIYEKLFPYKDKEIIISSGVRGVNLKKVKTVAKELNTDITVVEREIKTIEVGFEGTKCILTKKGKKHLISLMLTGKEYCYNAGVAVAAVEKLFKDKVEVDSFLERVGLIYIPARFEIFRQKDKTYLVDGSHNPEALRALINTIKIIFKGRKLAVVTGFLKDKKAEEMIRILKKISSNIILVPVKTAGERSTEEKRLKCLEDKLDVKLCSKLEKGVNIATDKSEVVVICGSLYLAGEARAILNKPFQTGDDCIDYFKVK